MYVIQLLNYVRPYGNQANEHATDGACGMNVREEKFFERLVERDYLLDLSVLKKLWWIPFISRGVIPLRTEYTKVFLVCVC